MQRITALSFEGTPAQQQRLTDWLGQPMPRGDVPLDFYENFHGVETTI